jgi:hypothetical protein
LFVSFCIKRKSRRFYIEDFIRGNALERSLAASVSKELRRFAFFLTGCMYLTVPSTGLFCTSNFKTRFNILNISSITFELIILLL